MEVKKKKQYTHADNAELCKMYQSGDKEAGNALCIVNKGLVHEIALKYAAKYGGDWYDDFFQEGMMGVLEAASKYNDELGAFSTYSVWYIRQRISRFGSNKTNNVYIPTNVVMLMNRCFAVDSKYQELPYYERVSKIGKELGLSEQKVDWLLGLRFRFRHSQSLDVPINEDSEMTLGEYIPDEKTDEIDTMLSEKTKEMFAHLFLSSPHLTDRERQVLKLRNGFVTGEAMTLDQVGREIGVTRERVRQIEAKACRKLRGMIYRVPGYKSADELCCELLADA